MLVTKCPECGQENDEGATICVTCDSSLDTDNYSSDEDDDIMDDDWDEDYDDDEEDYDDE